MINVDITGANFYWILKERTTKNLSSRLSVCTQLAAPFHFPLAYFGQLLNELTQIMQQSSRAGISI
jgi:hypothetical protein